MKYILFLIFCSTANANEIWVTTPEITSTEKLKSVTSKMRLKHPEHIVTSLYEAMLANVISIEDLNEVLNREQEARSKLLSGNLKQAVNQHKSILEILDRYPNIGGLEKVRHFNLTRLAEIYDSLRINDNPYWKKSASWNSFENISKEEFSPKTRQKLKAKLKKLKNTPAEIHMPFDGVVYVDGKKLTDKYRNIYRVDLKEGNHQVAALAPGSSWFITYVEIVPNEPIILIPINLEPVISGTCAIPQINFEFVKLDVSLLSAFSDGCEGVYKNGKWNTSEGQYYKVEQANHLDLSYHPQKQDSTFQKVIKSPWFWAGVVAVAGGVYLANNREETVVVERTVKPAPATK